MTLALPAPCDSSRPRRVCTARLATLGNTVSATAVTTAEYASRASRPSSGITASASRPCPICLRSPAAEPLALTAGGQHQLAHPGRVGLSAGGLHHRADDRAGRGHLAAADLFGYIGI